MKTRAAIAVGAGRPLEITEVDLEGPREGEVLVDIVACSINPADILLIEGNYATKPQTPCPLGIEGAGTVRLHLLCRLAQTW